MKRFACTVTLLLALGAMATAQESDARSPFGPPPEVIAAWEAGEGDLLPGPPEWVFGRRASRGKITDLMPPWVASMHESAVEIGLPGPPPEVIDAWEAGEGETLPGPPAFVLDILQMFWQ